MKNFCLINPKVETAHFLKEIASVENAWSLNTGRQGKISVQKEAEAIPIRGLIKSKIAGRKRWDVHESRWTTSAQFFPTICAFLEDFVADTGGALSRARIVRLKPHHRVYPHIDQGEYYRVRDRYHLVLKSEDGSWLRSGDEDVRMRTGELWWFDNKQVHEAFNDSDAERIHFIFDVLPAGADQLFIARSQAA